MGYCFHTRGCAVALAQQPTKLPRIGFLGATSPSTISARIAAFQQGLRELGYTEGKNIVIEYLWAEGKFDRVPTLAAELVQLKVDVIVTLGPIITRPAKEATSTIPIVMGFDNDPVGNGFVASLARPGGNITGLSNIAPEIGGKQLELLKEMVPRLSHCCLRELERAGQRAGVRRSRARRRSVQNEASIPRRTRPRAY